MAATTFSFRIAPPLYGLHQSDFVVPGVADLDDVSVGIILVDSGTPTVFRVVTKGAGSGVSAPGDNQGLLHNTRFDMTLPGGLEEWSTAPLKELAEITNRVIDWYRVVMDSPTVRRVPRTTIRGYAAHDTNGHDQVLGPLTPEPGMPSESCGSADKKIVEALSERLRSGSEVPIWATLLLDAQAEFLGGELRAAVLLANVSMESLINRAFREVGPTAEVAAAFEEPWTFWKVLDRVVEIVDTGRSKKEMKRLAARVNKDRNDVAHGNPVTLDEDDVADAITALRQLGGILFPAVVEHLLTPTDD